MTKKVKYIYWCSYLAYINDLRGDSKMDIKGKQLLDALKMIADLTIPFIRLAVLLVVVIIILGILLGDVLGGITFPTTIAQNFSIMVNEVIGWVTDSFGYFIAGALIVFVLITLVVIFIVFKKVLKGDTTGKGKST